MDFIENISFKVVDDTRVLINETKTYTDTTSSDFITSTYDLVDGTTDYPVELGRVGKIKYLFIDSSSPISIKLNSTSNTAIPVKFIVLSTVDATSLYITNSSGSTTNIKLSLVGIPT